MHIVYNILSEICPNTWPYMCLYYVFVQTYRKYAYPDSKLAKIGALTNGERVKPGGRGPPDKYTPEKDAIKKNTKNRKRRRNLRPRAAAKKAKQLRRD